MFSILRARSGGLLCVVLVVGTACDPGFEFRGSIRDTTGAPVVGAQVSVECSGAFARAETGAGGRFQYSALGWCPGSCTVQVRAPGYAPWGRPVLDYCKTRPRHIRDACLEVVADIVLAPSTPGPAAPFVPPPTLPSAGGGG
jgi:hypothetical protein